MSENNKNDTSTEKKNIPFVLTKWLAVWLWISLAATAAGAFLLYPISKHAAANIIFIIIKCTMAAGLLILLIRRSTGGYCIWCTGSVFAVLMTIIKWNLSGTTRFLYIIAIITDIMMPVIAYSIYRESFPDDRRPDDLI